MSYLETDHSITDSRKVSEVKFLISNSLSLGIVAIAGVAVNSILAFKFDVGVLGQFNQLFALHIVAAQFAAFGIHLSCLHYLSGHTKGSDSWTTGARVAIGAVAGVGSIVATILWVNAGLIEGLLDSEGLARGIRWVSPAVALFGINKVLMAIFNARDRLHAMAFLQALRPISWLAGTAVLIHLGSADAEGLGQILFFGELVAALSGAAFLSMLWSRPFAENTHSEWLGRHLRFGMKAMPSNLIVDLNTRIDVLVLAFFANDSTVGIYSFTALLAEGVFQVSGLLRSVINSRLVGVLIAKDQTGLTFLKRHSSRMSFWLTLGVSVPLAAGFVPAINLMGLDPALQEGHVSLLILLIGLVLSAMYWPFWMTLLLAGHPVQHSILMIALCALNIGMNVALIPFIGMLGAAIGTAVMLVAFPFMLSWATKRVLGMVL
jgi:O-antigen/teichoic acid export membrane protein